MQDRPIALEELCIATVRMLSIDMVEDAQSGHPGLPLGAAPMAWTLWDHLLRHNPADPLWPNRDRFILSPGHGSALLYALLHLTGYNLPLEEIKRFRQWGSLTPGHPEAGLTPGVDVTTGLLGQGFAMAVGMAMAQRHLAHQFNRPGFALVDHHIYVLASDGDVMEGVTLEAASLAGHLKLGRLIVLYDDNRITIDGPTSITLTEDTAQRFEACGWHILRVEDGDGTEAIRAALTEARSEKDRPSLIFVHTHIGYGSPKVDSPDCHGAPLGAEAHEATKRAYGWPIEPRYHIPPEVAAHREELVLKGQARQREWEDLFQGYTQAHPAEAARFLQQLKGELPEGWENHIPSFGPGKMATRDASGKVMNALAPQLPHFLGGSADLAASTKTTLSGQDHRNIAFGVREHAMGAMVNGMAQYGGVIPYGGTFFVFCDYMRPPLRMAALMRAPCVFIFTHDSIGVGEDGPTHQPVEHLISLRIIPELTVIRPADANETAAAWRFVIAGERPAVLVLTRQKVPVLDPQTYPIDQGVCQGAYILQDSPEPPRAIVIATGSEVHLALAAQRELAKKGVAVRVVSMPSWEVFARQSEAYRQRVLPPGIRARLAVEAGSAVGWHRWVGDEGEIIAMEGFGAAGPGEVVMEKFGFTASHVVARVLAMVARLEGARATAEVEG